MESTYKINRSVILYTTVTTLLLPCLLFVLGWITPFISVPFSLLLIYASWRCCRNCISGWHPAYHFCVFSRKDLWQLIITLLILLLVVDLLGIVGHVPQATDFAVRNAIYSELQKSPWPIYSARNEYFIYYHAYWLPPAFLTKILPLNIADYLLFLWVYITLALAAINLFTKLRGRVLMFSFVFLLTGNLIENAKFIPILIKHYGDIIPYSDIISNACLNFAVESYYRYLHVWSQFVYTFNHAIPLVLYVALLLSGIVSARYLLFVSALIFPASPLGVAPVFPILLYIIIKKRSMFHTFIRWENWVACLLVLLMLLYMLGQSGGNSGVVMIWQNFEYWHKVTGTYGHFVKVHVRVLRYVTVSAAMIATLRILTIPRLRKNIWYYSFVYLAIVLPIVWIGRWNNEFLFKGSLVLYMLFAWIITVQWKYASFKRRIVIILFTILASFHVISDVSRRNLYTYTWDPVQMKANKRLEWGGTINRPDSDTYNNFWGINKFPEIFCDEPGKSIIK